MSGEDRRYTMYIDIYIDYYRLNYIDMACVLVDGGKSPRSNEKENQRRDSFAGLKWLMLLAPCRCSAE
jgi:hypothetical protein